MIKWQNKGSKRHPARTWMIRVGVTLIAISGPLLIAGVMGGFSLETESITWNNIRFIAGASIFGCLLAAVGYGNE